ncbi:MAG: chromosome segregation protein SMC [Oscillospiraceae bacterium]|nr:chromosome segregation protein SMC [Oscillospiraceae bacterium]
MYLKALEIQGFKSFPEKTRLTFEKQITAIVGPNGSGKSNISDSIRWVMGEQSTRTLRGGKMEDVIFGGTELRNQVGFAEVSLILDNSARIFNLDQDEVMITRRYYRSGESEYAINREIVRLKDIHEILMDTGMGRDGYAIIDQGRIGEILSQRSIDRREILEEAAGISRFRHRKEESERKLQKTEDDLTRINDRVSELEFQVGPLKEQAEVAKRYLVLRDQLRGVEISLWLTQLEKLRAESIRLAADFETAKVQFAEANEAVEQMYKASETLSERFRAKDVESETARQRIADITNLVAEAESSVAVLRANVKGDTDAVERLTTEISEQEGRRDTLQAQIDERYARMEVIEREIAALNEKTETLLGRVSEIAQSQGTGAGDLDELMQKESRESVTLAGERERLSATEISIRSLEARGRDAEHDLAEANGKLDEVIAKRRDCRRALEEAQAERQTLHNMIRGHELKMGGREEKVAKLQGEVQSLTLEDGAIANRIGILADMEREFQGFHRSVKEVMQEAGRGRLQGVHGPVANLLRTDDRYTLAIETALGGASQNVIVDTPDDAKYAINFLKRRDAGRATFLPISSMRGERLTERELDRRPGYVGIALDLVKFDSKLEPVYRNLLGRTVIVENLDQAVEIARAFKNRFKLVTLDGQVISAGGSMTGGSAVRTAGFLSRANEIKTLEGKQAATAEKLEAKRAELEEIERELKSATATLDVSRGELRQVEDSVLKLEGDLRTHDTIRDAAQKACDDLEQEQRDIKAKLEAAKAEIVTLGETITEREQAVIRYRAEADMLTRGQKDLTEAREELNSSLADLQAGRASLAAERDADKQTILELEALAASLSGDKGSKEEQIAALEAEKEAFTLQIAEREAQIGKYKAQIETCRLELARIGAEKLELERERTNADRNTQERNREILSMERECSRLEQKKLAADMEEKQIIDRLWDTYELSHTAAQQMRQELESIAAASREVAKLKKEIAELGTPNIGAIEQYEIIGTRHAHFVEQRDDIEHAKSELEEIIADITKEMEGIFSEAFGQIDQEFRRTFIELFGGGQASLELEDPDNVLGSGVEIRVQPPGKSLKIISLLSGGEKAFTAIALYFAIQKIRPTPFCVMDEIEAALDEANVLRFAEYMRNLSHRTQFITITHRRGTMEEADMLYGVTMQERGVSRVIHVDLEEAERSMGMVEGQLTIDN